VGPLGDKAASVLQGKQIDFRRIPGAKSRPAVEDHERCANYAGRHNYSKHPPKRVWGAKEVGGVR